MAFIQLNIMFRAITEYVHRIIRTVLTSGRYSLKVCIHPKLKHSCAPKNVGTPCNISQTAQIHGLSRLRKILMRTISLISIRLNTIRLNAIRLITISSFQTDFYQNYILTNFCQTKFPQIGSSTKRVGCRSTF